MGFKKLILKGFYKSTTLDHKYTESQKNIPSISTVISRKITSF